MIVSDSTSLIHLSRIGKLELLQMVFGKVLIPDAVYRETIIKGRGRPDAKNIASQQWILKKDLPEKQQEEADGLLKAARIGQGEAEAIILAQSEKTGLLIDDAAGVRVAQTFGINTYWTTSVILKAVAEKKLGKREARQIVEDLVRGGYRLRPEIVIEILDKLSE